ncbi:MAG: capsule assembly Wzi family protein [Fidelibacterota bacterium]
MFSLKGRVNQLEFVGAKSVFGPKLVQFKYLILAAVVITLWRPAAAQRYIPADPLDLMFHEKAYFQEGIDYGPLIIRPVFISSRNRERNLSITLRSELFNNTNAPNLENTSDRWIGKGDSFFSSVNISYSGPFLALSLEPYYFSNQNLPFDEAVRIGKYMKLNDNQPFEDSPYRISGLREVQAYLHYKGVGFGFSNANMWWGPGIHSTLNMTNNTRGFNHLMVGTLREQRIGKVGLDARYVFSDMDSLNADEPYFTALVLTTTLHSDPVVTVGLSRTYLSGGNSAGKDTLSRKEAMMLPVEGLFLQGKQTDPDDPLSSVDIWDQTLSGYLSASFPNSGLKVFLELGRNDHAWNGVDLRRQPDHTSAAIVGLRKYGLFGNDDLTFGMEYANLMKSPFTIQRRYGEFREGADWYDRAAYDYSSYNGRRWGAHSGADSDDFTVYVGYLGDRFSIIPGFNYERHGILDNRERVWVDAFETRIDPDTRRTIIVKVKKLLTKDDYMWAEVKFEFRLDIRYRIRGLRFNLYYEKEFVDNVGFTGGNREGEVVWFGVERVFDGVWLPRFLSWF